MDLDDLQIVYSEIAKVISELERLGDFDSNAPYLRFILKSLYVLVEHEIEISREKFGELRRELLEATKSKAPAPPPKRGRKKGHRKVLRRKT
jgi:hypothetical protein